MAIASFEEFSKGICEVAGIDPPVLEPDEYGAQAFSMRIRDLPVTVVHTPSRPDAAILLAELGPMPEEQADAAWATLMEINMLLVGRDSPVFSRHPLTGEVVLQRALSLSRLTVLEAFERVQRLVDMGLRWKEDRYMSEDMSGYASATDVPAGVADFA